MRSTSLLAVAGLFLMQAACTSSASPVRFDRIDVNAIDFTAIDSNFVFKVSNPTPLTIDVADYDYNLAFAGVDLFSGDDGDGIRLEAISDTEFALPVGFEWQSAWDLVQATRGEDVIDFECDGAFGFDSDQMGHFELPYDANGDFPALRTPKFTFQKFKVNSVNWSKYTADVAVDLGVDNEHESNLSFANFGYTLKLGGSKVADGVTDAFDVEGATTGTKTIQATIDLANVSNAVIDAFSSGGDVDAGIAATSDVDTPFGTVPLSIDETGKVKVDL